MRILIATPSSPLPTANGNQVTSRRLDKVFVDLGHSVERVRVANLPLESGQRGWQPDVVVALHAGHAARAVEHFCGVERGVAVVVVLTGTDLYRDFLRGDESVARSLRLATRLVGLQDQVPLALPASLRGKCRVIYQSCQPTTGKSRSLVRCLEMVQVGHMRPEKDPLRAAMAVRRLPPSSKIRLTHVGGCYEPVWERRVREEQQRNRRFVPLGAKSWLATRRLIARAAALVTTSRLEGAGNVVGEAIVDGIPVLASRIAGSIGMLGEDYAGYFEVGNTDQLRLRMQQFEDEPAFRERLYRQVLARQSLLRPSVEARAWQDLFAELTLP